MKVFLSYSFIDELVLGKEKPELAKELSSKVVNSVSFFTLASSIEYTLEKLHSYSALKRSRFLQLVEDLFTEVYPLDLQPLIFRQKFDFGTLPNRYQNEIVLSQIKNIDEVWIFQKDWKFELREPRIRNFFRESI